MHDPKSTGQSMLNTIKVTEDVVMSSSTLVPTHFNEQSNSPANDVRITKDELKRLWVVSALEPTNSEFSSPFASNISLTTDDLLNDIEDCNSWEIDQDWTPRQSPQISLDPDNFLYPGLYGGPNNQIFGLRQSVYLAIRLSRTLVVPKFFPHKTTGEVTIELFERIDVKRPCRFISCISTAQQKSKCGHEADQITVSQFEEDTGLTFHKNTEKMEKRKSIPGGVDLRLADGSIIKCMPSLVTNDSLWNLVEVRCGNSSKNLQHFGTKHVQFSHEGLSQ
ncbi:unnamed protein product [Clavelina lepadiformis]|uniref:Uncharacterized protein n=1 Tax=Clavelina lepadiformis TaxID=159417 RepID=A0ABP0GMG0_CLALP